MNPLGLPDYRAIVGFGVKRQFNASCTLLLRRNIRRACSVTRAYVQRDISLEPNITYIKIMSRSFMPKA